MSQITLNLNHQNRDRTFYVYQKSLMLSNMDKYYGKDILMIGGGMGPYEWGQNLNANIINYDFHIPERGDHSGIISIRDDFTKSKKQYNMFDEIWALYSLPVYCASIPAVDLFFAKCILALRPRGAFRVSPIEPFMTSNEMVNPTPMHVFVNRFYKNMNDYAAIGGTVKTMWYGDPFSLMTTDYNKQENLSKKYPNIEYKYDDNVYECCAIIGKPREFADQINNVMELKIADTTRRMTKESFEIRVIANSEVRCY